MKDSEEYVEALNKAYKEAGHNAYFGNGFGKGYDFAMSQPKHIYDSVAVVGEKRRFEGGLVDVVESKGNCTGCIFKEHEYSHICTHLTKCCTNLVIYIKR